MSRVGISQIQFPIAKKLGEPPLKRSFPLSHGAKFIAVQNCLTAGRNVLAGHKFTRHHFRGDCEQKILHRLSLQLQTKFHLPFSDAQRDRSTLVRTPFTLDKFVERNTSNPEKSFGYTLHIFEFDLESDL